MQCFQLSRIPFALEACVLIHAKHIVDHVRGRISVLAWIEDGEDTGEVVTAGDEGKFLPLVGTNLLQTDIGQEPVAETFAPLGFLDGPTVFQIGLDVFCRAPPSDVSPIPNQEEIDREELERLEALGYVTD